MAGGVPYVCSGSAGGTPTMLRVPGMSHMASVLLAISLLAGTAAHAASASQQGASSHADSASQQTASATGEDSREPQEAREAAPVDRGEAARRAVDRIFDDPLAGVVVNRTVTVLGKDFYQAFSTRWRQNPEAARYSISIHERPSARFGSEIWVQYRQQRVFHTFLPPARAATRPISEAAIPIVLKNVSRREVERRTTWNPDMGPEEL